jgi:hypothetical protein
VTEEEAKTKWCPQARAQIERTESAPVGNRDRGSRPDIDCLCIGSACMWWRWNDPEGLDKPTRVHPNVLKDHWQGWTVTDPTPDAKGYVEISPPPPKLPRGYCGPAGKP